MVCQKIKTNTVGKLKGTTEIEKQSQKLKLIKQKKLRDKHKGKLKAFEENLKYKET
jgi:hypothetical protein